MKSCAIYYPYIMVPQSLWFTRVLLYWDEVGAIVPYEYLEDPDRLGQYMVGLVREQLVTQIVPGMHLWKVNNFADAFIRYVDHKAHTQAVSRKLDWAHIHMEKLQEVGDKLYERGLARRDPKNQYSPWYEVEPQTAGDFMAYLAAVLGQLTGDHPFYPITDQESHLEPFLPQSPAEMHEHLLRRLILDNILPAPSKAIDPARLAEFKAEHKPELQRFRREIEDKISELSIIGDDEDRQKRLGDILGNMQESIHELAARMRESNWPRLDLGTLFAIVGSGINIWKGVINQDLSSGLLGASTLARAVYDAFRGSDVHLEDKPLAYAVLAARRFA